MNLTLNTKQIEVTTFDKLKLGDAFINANQYNVGDKISAEEVHRVFERNGLQVSIKSMRYDTGEEFLFAFYNSVLFREPSCPVIKLEIKNIEFALA